MPEDTNTNDTTATDGAQGVKLTCPVCDMPNALLIYPDGSAICDFCGEFFDQDRVEALMAQESKAAAADGDANPDPAPKPKAPREPKAKPAPADKGAADGKTGETSEDNQ